MKTKSSERNPTTEKTVEIESLALKLCTNTSADSESDLNNLAALVKERIWMIVRGKATIEITEAEDIVGDFMHKKFQLLLDRFDSSKGKFDALVYRSATRSIIDYFRRARALNTMRINYTSELDHEFKASCRDNVPRPLDLGILTRALQELPLQHQITLRHAFWDGMSQSEIAEHLGQPLSTIKARIRRGQMRLGEILTELGFDRNLARLHFS